MSSTTKKKETEAASIHQNNNFVRLLIYSIVGVMAVFVGSLYAYKYFNPPPPESDDEQVVAPANQEIDNPDNLMRVLLALRNNEGNVTEEEFEKYHNQRITASEKLLEIATNDDHKINAHREKLDALVKLNSMSVEGAYDRLTKFATSLKDEKLGNLDMTSRCAMHTVHMRRSIRDPKIDMQPTIDALELDMDRYKNNDDFFSYIMRVIRMMYRERRSKVAAKLVATALPYYRQSKSPASKKQVEFLEGLLALEKYAFGQIINRLVRGIEGSIKDFKTGVSKIVDDKSVSSFVYDEFIQALRTLEKAQRYDEAKELNEFLKTKLSEYPDKNVAKYAKEDCEMALKRLELLGKKFELKGYTLKGKPFDASRLAGSLHLVVFVSASAEQSFVAMESLIRRYGTDPNSPIKLVCYIDDDKPYDVVDFMRQRAPHWESSALILVPNSGRGQKLNGYTEKIGIQEVPYLIVLDKKTVVRDINVLPGYLQQSIDKINGKSPAPSKNKSGKWDLPALKHVVANPSHLVMARYQEDEKEKKQEDENPYLAPKHWSVSDLVDMVLGAEDKPRSIRRRPQFALAIADAADRILSDGTSKKAHKRIAVIGKTKILHEQACLGDADMDQLLVKSITAKNLPDDKRVKSEIDFLKLEQKIIAATEVKVDSEEQIKTLKTLIDESKKFFESNVKSLTNRHLRLASTTIELVNLLSSEDSDLEQKLVKQRDEYFKSLGSLFAKGQDKRLVKYGKYLAKSEAASPSALVGKPLELAGDTHDGNEFDWKSYRGKVVVVDFWATWCGPCRKEMPNVKALYEKMNARGFEVVGVALDDDPDAVVEYVEEEEIPWQNIVGAKAKQLAQKYGVKGIPTMMLVDRQGNILAVANRVGQFGAEIEKQLKKAEGKR